MSKGLEALKSMWLYIDEPTKRQFALQDYKIIEKELKALNVFKELKFFDVKCDKENGKMIYLLVWNAVAITRISKEQYDLLKEGLL